MAGKLSRLLTRIAVLLMPVLLVACATVTPIQYDSADLWGRVDLDSDRISSHQSGFEHAMTVGGLMFSNEIKLENSASVDGRIALNFAEGEWFTELSFGYAGPEAEFGSGGHGKVFLGGLHLMYRPPTDFVLASKMFSPYVGLGLGGLGFIDFQSESDSVAPAIIGTMGIDINLSAPLAFRIEARDWAFYSDFGPFESGASNGLEVSGGLILRF